MAVNYTEAQVEFIVDEYSNNPTRETVENLADTLGKSVKSIIGKLSREGVYQKTEYLTKTGEKPVTKLEIVENIEEVLGCKALTGLEKAPKTTLKELENAILSIKQD